LRVKAHHAPSRFIARPPILYKAFTARLRHFYRPWFYLDKEHFSPQARRKPGRPAHRKAGTGIAHMFEIRLEFLWLAPVALAVAFMLWVLWNMHRDEKR
jgi:hypothetical protein